MTDVREATEALLADKPDLESSLRDLLALDADGPWTFDDTGLDSGTFGEIVSRGIVEEVDDGYRITDREGVEAVLTGDGNESNEESRTSILSTTTNYLDRYSRRGVAVLAILLLCAALIRVVPMWNAVIRAEHIVLAGNDPYFYRYYGETLLEMDIAAFDPTALGALPQPIRNHDVLMILFVWWTSTLFGADASAVGTVLAWYPVVAAVVTVGAVYAIAHRLTDDRRVAIAGAAILAVTPAHAFRTALGFGDHHPFDYFWLTLALLGLVVSVQRDRSFNLRSVKSVWPIVLLGTSVSAIALSWRGGPFLLIPLGIVSVVVAVTAVENDENVVDATAPFVVGLAFAGLLTAGIHLGTGIVEPYRGLAPLLLFVGTVGVVGVCEAVRRYDGSGRSALGASVLTGAITFSVAWIIVPDLRRALFQLVEYLVSTGSSGIAETASLFDTGLGTVLGPVFLFGFFLFLALPTMVLGVIEGFRQFRLDWLSFGIITWYLFVLTVLQIRFAGYLAIPASVFAGAAFVGLANRLDLTSPLDMFSDSDTGRQSKQPHLNRLSLPDFQTLRILAVLFLLVGSMSFVQTPIKMSQISVDEDTYDTAVGIDQYADAEKIENADRYVLSQWGRNRVYNYFVNGDSESYAFARERYADFLTSQNESAAMESLSGKDVGFVVTTDAARTGPTSVGERLHRNLGSHTEEADGLGRFQLVHDTSDGAVRAFRVVPGAEVYGHTESTTGGSLSTDVDLNGTSFTYERAVPTTDSGSYVTTVAYPGTYTDGAGDVAVSETDVENGSVVVDPDLRTTPRSGELSRWTFDGDFPRRGIDRVGNNHGTYENVSLIDSSTDGGFALSVTGDGRFSVPDSNELDPSNGSFTISFWIKGDLGEADAGYPTVIKKRGTGNGYTFGARNNPGTFGTTVYGSDGRTDNYAIGTNDFEDWTHVTAVMDREDSELRLYRNGSKVGTSPLSVGEVSSDGDLQLFSRFGTPVQFDDVRMFARPLDDEEVEAVSGSRA